VDFGVESGLPPGEIREMVESEGIYWIRTGETVAFYDGFEWVIPPPFPAGEGVPVTSLSAGTDGNVAVVAGGEVFRGDTAGLEPVVLPGALAHREVVRAFPDPEGGTILSALAPGDTLGGVFRVEAGEVRELSPRPLVKGHGTLAWRGRSGGFWASTTEGLLKWDGKGWRPRKEKTHQRQTFSHLTTSRDGEGLAFRDRPTWERALFRWKGSGPLRKIASEGGHGLLHLDVGPEGRALVVWETGDVRYRGEDGWRGVTTISSLRTQGLYFAHLSQNGDVWLASSGGLHWFRQGLDRWAEFSFPFPDFRNRIHALLPLPDGTLWIGTEAGPGRVTPDGSIGGFRTLGQVRNPSVTGLARDSAGTIWAVSGGDFEGAYRLAEGTWSHVGEEAGLRGRIHDVAVDGEGGVWFLSLGGPEEEGAGVYRFWRGGISRWSDPLGRLDTRAYAFAEGPEGARWFGTARGLIRWKEGRWTYWPSPEEEGTAPPKVFTLAVDSGGVPWFGGGYNIPQGLGTLGGDGRIKYYREETDGLPSDEVWDVEVDEEGRIWFSTNRGVGLLTDGAVAVFDSRTGLKPEGVWPIALWAEGAFLGTQGGGVVHLSRQEEDHPPPRIRISPVLHEKGILHLGWEAFPFNGETSPSQVLTRFRMDGDDWSAWSRERSAMIPGAPPGEHTVTVEALSLFGNVSRETRGFRVPPPFFRSPMVVVPVSLLLAVILGLGTFFLIRKRRHDEALRESEERFRTVVEGAPEAIALYDEEKVRFTEMNANGLRLFGLTRAMLATTDPGELAPPVQADGRPSAEVSRELMGAARAGESPVTPWTIRRTDGREIPCELRLVVLPYQGRSLIRFSLVDISDRIEAEERRKELEGHLFQAQKLEAVGQLTGGVAHDFNNLLTVIQGNLELLLEELRLDQDSTDLVDGAARAAKRGGLLTQRLLAFSRRQTLAPRRLEVDELVGNIVHLIQRTLGETIVVRTALPEGLWAIEADPSQLESALLNLAINARDAMPRGGDLVIEARNVTLAPEDVEGEELEPGPYVRLSVSDTGSGMDSDVAKRVFEPFFTTKEVGKGSGLGLSMVYGFTRQSGGTATLESEVGVGTTVHLFFPKAPARRDHAGKGVAQEAT
jgi:PAS domain S-box-containing protein